jgi:aryl carrier-like protein
MSFEEAQENILKSSIDNIKLVQLHNKFSDNNIEVEFSPEDAT